MSKITTSILGTAIALIFGAGVFIVVVQPGDFGSDSATGPVAETTTSQATPAGSTTTQPTTGTTIAANNTTTEPSTTETPDTSPAPTDAPTTAAPAPTTTAAPAPPVDNSGTGSGLGSSGVGDPTGPGLADTGSESLAVPGLILSLVAVALRRRRLALVA